MLFLLFHLDDDCYALDVIQVAQVLPLLAIRSIPHAPFAVAGIIDYRGQAVPVIDLNVLALGRAARKLLSTRIILVHYTSAQGPKQLLGLIAERVTQTFRCDASEFRTSGVANLAARYLGPVAIGPAGLVQQVTTDALLTPALQALLFGPHAGA